jgi:hypothetical protein
MNGGDAAQHVEPRYTWFGRNDYELDPVVLSVTSTPILAVPLTIDVTDLDGNKNGTTSFTRRFTRYQGYQLTAPSLFTTAGTTYVFQRWVVDGLPRSGINLTVANMGPNDDAVEAQYLARRTIRFETSPHITTTVGLTVTPPDLNGQTNGFTPFTRQYLQGTVVRMTFSGGSVGGHPFKQWIVGGLRYPLGQTTVDFTVGSNDATATLEFYVHTPGSYASFGAACPSSNGQNVHSGVTTPELGRTITLQLVGGPVSMPCAMLLGGSNTTWSGLPLPLALPGAAPCVLNVAPDVTLPTGTGTGGVAIVRLTLPTTTNLIRSHVYTQYVSVDIGVNQLGVTTSNGVDTLIGGSR